MNAFDSVLAQAARLARYEDARARSLLALHDISVVINGPATPEATQAADHVRAMIAGVQHVPEVLVVGPKRNRAARRREAAQRRQS